VKVSSILIKKLDKLFIFGDSSIDVKVADYVVNNVDRLSQNYAFTYDDFMEEVRSTYGQ